MLCNIQYSVIDNTNRYAFNTDKIIEYRRSAYKNNRDAILEKQHDYRVKKRGENFKAKA